MSNSSNPLTLPEGTPRRKGPENRVKKRFNHQDRIEDNIGKDIVIWDNDSVVIEGQILGTDSFTLTIRLSEENRKEISAPSDVLTIFKHAIGAFCINCDD